MVRYFILLFYVCTLLFPMLDFNYGGTHVPSKERGDPNYRKDTNIDINKVRATIYNWGYSGKLESEGVSIGYGYEWPVNSGDEYVFLTGLAVGAELIVGGNTTELISTIFREDAGHSLSWEPVKGYMNNNFGKIAISDDPNTWPDYWPDKMDDGGWPGSWNGYFGKDKFNADQEIYYKISDDRNQRQGVVYEPDETDITRKGLGLLTGVRVMQWKQILIENVVFQLYDIQNDGTKDLDKVAFTLWYADYVGGDGNDILEFELADDVAWNYDMDPSKKLGTVAISYIETPGNNVDRIDNDGDSTPIDNSGNFIYSCQDNGVCEQGGPQITIDMIENIFDGKDNNGNGLIDENISHTFFGGFNVGVAYADHIDNDGDAEPGSPIITDDMISQASSEWGI